MSLGNRYYSNDYLQGSYKGVRFERADIKIQNRVYTGKHSLLLHILMVDGLPWSLTEIIILICRLSERVLNMHQPKVVSLEKNAVGVKLS